MLYQAAGTKKFNVWGKESLKRNVGRKFFTQKPEKVHKCAQNINGQCPMYSSDIILPFLMLNNEF